MCYPDNCIRGINNPAQVEDDLVGSDVFYFFDNHARPDGTIEESINWEDDDHARDFTLRQTNDDGTLKHKGGCAVIPRSNLDNCAALRAFSNAFSYERSAIEEVNPYHGNLLLTPGVERKRRKAIAQTLAMQVSEIIPSPYN
jgi:hypothetical protein